MATSKHHHPIPDALDSAQAKLVYLTLRVCGETPASDLQRTLGVPKLTLFAVLESLAAKDLVRRTEDGYVCR